LRGQNKIPAHWHPIDVNIAALKEVFLAGAGETFDENKLTPKQVGSFVDAEANAALCFEQGRRLSGRFTASERSRSMAEVVSPDARAKAKWGSWAGCRNRQALLRKCSTQRSLLSVETVIASVC
jgi:hypothetical protein